MKFVDSLTRSFQTSTKTNQVLTQHLVRHTLQKIHIIFLGICTFDVGTKELSHTFGTIRCAQIRCEANVVWKHIVFNVLCNLQRVAIGRDLAPVSPDT